MFHAVCLLHSESLSIWDLIGYALGPLEISPNPDLSHHRTQYFFGEEWHRDCTRASILAILTDVTVFFGKMFATWRVPFLTSELTTLGVRSSMAAPSPGISRILSHSGVFEINAECRVSF
jgi:hypothetical protein